MSRLHLPYYTKHLIYFATIRSKELLYSALVVARHCLLETWRLSLRMLPHWLWLQSTEMYLSRGLRYKRRPLCTIHLMYLCLLYQ
jgi:hypothetical protein